MFKKLLDELKKLEQGIHIPISLPLDDEGYFDRHCPSEECEADFKVLFEDWRDKVSDERVFCPICRYEMTADSWNTPEQSEYIRAVAPNHLQGQINTALKEDARRFNRSQKPGFISLSLSVKPGRNQIVLPVGVADTMRQTFVCEVCGCRYASVGLAYFCPACGHNSVLVTFERTIDIVRQVMGKTSEMSLVLEEVIDKDTARDSVRNILEDSLCRLVGAFQYFAENLFNRQPGAASIKQRRNVFQNLAESSALWKTLTGKGYDDLLSRSEYSDLELLFQKRHLIVHRNGIIDQEYITKSGDNTHSIGQRLVISEGNVLRLADILSTLSVELRKLDPSGQ
ncbi:MAG: hypothetical protein KJ047_01835 [Anaerolineae bacterium]|nr:hypothetical protein [Anaerolineae bacterium]